MLFQNDPACPYPAPAENEAREFLSLLFRDNPLDRSHLVQILVALQQRFGWIPPQSCRQIEQHLAINAGEIRAVVAFYHFLTDQPPAPYRLWFSNHITDLYQGQKDLIVMARRFAEENPTIIDVGETSCMGLGDQGPAALLNGLPLTQLNRRRLQAVLEYAKNKTPLALWPKKWFRVQDNIRQRGLLLKHHIEPGALLKKLLADDVDALMGALEQAHLLGRGGAGFATFSKWQRCREIEGNEKFVVCNADEGEPGTFKDRVLLHSHIENILEAMTLCGRTIGAKQGFIYLRGEYYFLLQEIEGKIQQRLSRNLLGSNILGQAGFDFNVTVHLGAGAYICGEESALIASLEGKRGIPGIRPPFPVQAGYKNLPTVVNNVETFCNVSLIADQGVEVFRQQGTEASPGSKIHSVSGDVARPGIYEFSMALSIAEILQQLDVRDCQAVLVGGPAGTLVLPHEFTRRIAFDDIHSGGSLILFNQSRSLAEVVTNYAQFFNHESCGFCTPCRVGSEIVRQICQQSLAAEHSYAHRQQALAAAKTMTDASHCGLGQSAGLFFSRALAVKQIATDLFPESSVTVAAQKEKA